jgi:hypothetical protein
MKISDAKDFGNELRKRRKKLNYTQIWKMARKLQN